MNKETPVPHICPLCGEEVDTKRPFCLGAGRYCRKKGKAYLSCREFSSWFWEAAARANKIY